MPDLVIGYSFLRFSTPEQAKGDSRRRQTADAVAWCQRHGVHLDTSLWQFDPAASAFLGAHRQNPDRHALASFLKRIEDGEVPQGSYLIVENLDRLTREHVRAAVTLVLSILERGIHIVTTNPEKVYRHDSQEITDVIIMVVELARGHGESKRRSELCGAAWAQKRRLACEGKNQPPRDKDGRVTRSLTDMLPAWVEDLGGKLVLRPAQAAAVRRVFELAAAGYGKGRIVQTLTAEKVPAIGKTGKWLRAYVSKLLRDRRTVGEWRPKSRGKPHGEPVADYYPAVVTEELWLVATAAVAGRLNHRGRRGHGGGKFINLFDDLLHDARDGSPYYVHYRGPRGRTRRVLLNASGWECHAPRLTFPLDVFERLLLDRLAEVDPAEITRPKDKGQAKDKVLGLSREKAGVEAELAKLDADLQAHGFSDTLARRARALEKRKATLTAELKEAKQQAAHPLSETWGQAQTLLGALDDAPDPVDARLRLRAALRRVIESIWLLIVPVGSYRFCACQVWFKHDGRRDYLFLRRLPVARGPEKVWPPLSLAEAAPAAGDCDLRNRDHAAKVEKMLASIDPAALQGD